MDSARFTESCVKVGQGCVRMGWKSSRAGAPLPMSLHARLDVFALRFVAGNYLRHAVYDITYKRTHEYMRQARVTVRFGVVSAAGRACDMSGYGVTARLAGLFRVVGLW